MIQYCAVTANASFALLAEKPEFIFVLLTSVCFPNVILGIARFEVPNFFDAMVAKNFPLFMAASAVFTQEVIAIGTIELQRLSFVAVSTVW